MKRRDHRRVLEDGGERRGTKGKRVGETPRQGGLGSDLGRWGKGPRVTLIGAMAAAVRLKLRTPPRAHPPPPSSRRLAAAAADSTAAALLSTEQALRPSMPKSASPMPALGPAAAPPTCLRHHTGRGLEPTRPWDPARGGASGATLSASGGRPYCADVSTASGGEPRDSRLLCVRGWAMTQINGAEHSAFAQLICMQGRVTAVLMGLILLMQCVSVP